jgi:hypothetical protein
VHLRRRSLDVLLAILAIVSAVVVLLSYEDPSIRVAVCTHTGFCSTFAKAWYKLLYDLGIGALVSLAFYYLVVRLPDYQRRQRLKRSLETHYKAFRENCIGTMLRVADGSSNSKTTEALMEPDQFRQYFKQQVGPCTDRWHEFVNKLNASSVRELQTHLEIFRDELIFILNNTDIPKDGAFEYLKRLSAAMYSMKTVTPDYDEIGPLAGFLWDVFVAWDSVKGYRKEDVIKKMIDEI